MYGVCMRIANGGRIRPRNLLFKSFVVISQEGSSLRNSFEVVVPPTCNLPGGFFGLLRVFVGHAGAIHGVGILKIGAPAFAVIRG